ncbi:MAG: bifunctional [glutamine synthetase] adenylyltransferase/[glutamine synthetase]-adenylyl-L-tyrosine phosphorylase [Rhizobiaceae bacterium]
MSAVTKPSGEVGDLFGFEPKTLAPMDKQAARRQLAELAEAAKDDGSDRVEKLAKANGSAAVFLGAVMDLSPFLRDAAVLHPHYLEALFDVKLDHRIETLIQSIPALGHSCSSESDLMAALRLAKSEAHFLIALGDLGGRYGGHQTTSRVSRLAVAATQAAVRFLLLEGGRTGKLNVTNLEDPEKGSGWIILGMGKLGAQELNYSSDIDLIVLFDPWAGLLPDVHEGIEVFSRLTRRLVRIMQDRTSEGYVFRTDLRLRPDPGSTPLAIPVEAALNYYEGRGQNWERAALIKAMPIAGDIAAGDAFLRELSPFIWRKYLDYAAIADVHSIKRQIHAHKGHGEVAVLGHNVKLGRGGIREIEFFVQTQQLIAGGREPELRGRETIAMLAKLAEKGWIAKEAAETLTREYWFLRDIEHRIQMVADEQTHSLPDSDEELLRIARMAGFKTTQDFSERLRASLLTVEKHYAELFEAAPELSTGLGNLVFTGDNDDPGTIETLATLGFTRPSDMCRIIRTWHFGRYKATQSAEARERLTELTPSLLRAFGASKSPDDTMVHFDGFLQGLPSGIQLFSLLGSNPALLELLVTIMGAAPRLSDIITRKPHVFDGLLDPAIYRDVPTTAYLADRLDAFLDERFSYEEKLDRLRIFASEQKFLIGVRMLTGALAPVAAGTALSNLADLLLDRTFALVKAEFETKHGKVEGGQVALLGLGKLGSRELTAGSDIDLILLYDHDGDAGESDGGKPLYPSHYYSRLTQRLIAAVSAPTAEGVLYELDLRLRPSGNKGPVATRLSAFETYQSQEAWTWEHMAMSRGRVVTGDAELATRIANVLDALMAKPREMNKITGDIAEMRGMIEKEKPAKGPFDLKLMPGGLIDLEFIAQFAVIAAKFSGKRSTSTQATLSSLKDDRLTAGQIETLAMAHRLYSSMTQILRLCLNNDPDSDAMGETLLEIMCRAADMPDEATLAAHVKNTAGQVRKIFNLLFRAPHG